QGRAGWGRADAEHHALRRAGGEAHSPGPDARERLFRRLQPVQLEQPADADDDVRERVAVPGGHHPAQSGARRIEVQLVTSMHARHFVSWVVAGLVMAATIAVRTADTPKAGDVSEARVIAEAASGANWLVGGGTFEEQHFSPLKQITDQN